jgi:peptide/nickel transport system substrate-binding protein
MRNKVDSTLRAAVVVLGIILLFVLWGDYTGAAEPKPQYGGILKISDQREGPSIGRPSKMPRTSFSQRHVSPVLETLFRCDKEGKPIPYLVSTVKENAKAGTIVLGLKKGIKFHDGTDFNAEAVKWNLDDSIAAKTSGTEKFKSIDFVDPYTVRINLTEWDSAVTTSLTQQLGMMISPTACRKAGDQVCANQPVGTGPFQFVSWEKDKLTVYKKFPGYWQKGKPYLDGIEWTPIEDPLSRELSFRKGEFQVSLTVAPNVVAGLEKDGFVVNRNRLPGAMTLVPDSANPNSPFAKLKVRQAIQYAIDPENIVKNIYFNEAVAVNQWIYKGHWGYNPNVAGYPYNPAKAKQLLTEAGYPNGFKTKITFRTNPTQDQVFAAVQGYLKAVGIEAELEPLMIGRYDEIVWKGGKWEGLMMNAVPPNPDLVAILAINYAGRGKEFAQMAVPEDYAKAIQNAINAQDFKAKQKWTREAMKLMIDKYALQTTLLCRMDFAVSTKKVHNHGNNTTPNNGFWTPEETWMEK